MKVIILSSSTYKEKDAVVSAISDNSFITFLAKGVNGPKSKNIPINNALTIADIELMDGNFKYPILKAATPLFTPLHIEMDSKYLGSLLLMNEITNYLFPDEEKPRMFYALEECIIYLKRTRNWLMVLLLYLANAIRTGGFEFEVNRCVRCHGKNRIVAFSFVEGGFICEQCCDEEVERDLTKDQMILLRKIFNDRNFALLNMPLNQEDAVILLKRILAFCEEAFGYHFKNLRLIFD